MGLLLYMLEGSAATCGAVLFSNPFEVVKIRLQLQGELQHAGAAELRYRGLAHGLRVIARHEGVASVQKGLSAALALQAVMNGIRLGAYEPTKDVVSTVLPEGVVTNAVSGLAVGFVGAWIASPLNLVKTRMQSTSDANPVGTQYKYRGLAHGLRSVAAEKGLAGLYHGALTAGLRTAAGSSVQLTSYELLKRELAVRGGLGGLPLHVGSSLLTSAVVALAMNPFDVVMTRVYNNKRREYTANFPAAFAKIVRAEGAGGLFKGAFALWARIGPHTVLTFVFLEQIRGARRRAFPDWA
jgi:solute carrier family 25 protein 34/35